ncbi:MAG TPA: hypothetical protein VNG32_04270 [Candidatus Dormibacteraeota bacterium]|nr:hypothetical protein [Candidatus Dormibacteraeota bacterium]
MAQLPLETSLNDLFVKKAPALPAGGKKFLVEYLPWINLILGLISLYTAWVLWHWAHFANSLVNYANSLSAAYGGPVVATNRMTVGIWLGIAVLAVEAILYIAAFPGTRDRKKSGWNLLYYALLINIVYGVLVLFTNYGGVANLIGAIIGSAIGLYLLFQIRSSYGAKAVAGNKNA